MKRILISSLAVAGLLSFAAPVFAATAYPIGTVNIRSGPGTTNTIVGSLSDGQTAPVLSHDGTWLKVQTAGGTVGYMADWVTREVFDDGPSYLQVNTDVLNVRATPDLSAAVLGQVQQGQQLRLLEGLGGWYKVDAGSAGIGWVKGEYTYRVPTAPSTGGRTPPPAPLPGDAPKAALSKQVQATVATTIYNGRGTDYDAVADVRAWEHLTYVDSAEGWLKVNNADGLTGWIDGTQALLWDDVDFAHQALYSVKENDWSLRFLKVRQVVPGGDGLAVRSGPSADAGVLRTLNAGDQMKLVQVPATEFVQVQLPDGLTGWVSRKWLMPLAVSLPTEQARLYQTSPGVLRLEVTGQSAAAAVTDTATALTVSMPDNANRRAALTVEEHGISSVTMSQQGLTLRFDQSFRYQVVEQAADHTTIEIRPVITQVESLKGADRDIYRFHMGGLVEPSATRSGGAVVLNLPGAVLPQGVALPAGLTAQATATGVTVTVTDSRAFALKQRADSFDLELLQPGLAGKTIVIDPGHGGSETGAVADSGLMEKDATLAIALKLKPLLEAAGAKVILTRSGDARCASPDDLAKIANADDKLHYDLNCRSVVANTAGADAFVSIHNNANPDSSVRGTETYWSAESLNGGRGQVLAGLVQQQMVSALGTQDLGAKLDVFYVTKYTDAPAILTEVAFLSNPTEGALLGQDAFRQKAAQAIFKGLQAYFQ